MNLMWGRRSCGPTGAQPAAQRGAAAARVNRVPWHGFTPKSCCRQSLQLVLLDALLTISCVAQAMQQNHRAGVAAQGRLADDGAERKHAGGWRWRRSGR